ncbi:MAG: nucleotidyltransferase [Gammaproteobacteria bacterium]|nr:MAG: nucleotidyltransferase [Gammaproteobacteria bacterium]
MTPAQPQDSNIERMTLLQLMGHELDLTETQRETAQSRYEAVGNWIADEDAPELESAVISPQGSIALGTATKPIGANEFDVDLISHLSRVTPSTPPWAVKRLVGERLRQNARYAEVLEEKQRCWRLNYAGEFHLDITPSIPNPECSNGGELVPDKKLREWKPTNPKGYRARFEQYASIEPRFEVQFAEARKRASVEPLPPVGGKNALRLIVQICKRHRDIYFLTRNRDLAPVSIILTTLAAWSYARCARANVYPSELALLIDVAKTMPLFIQRQEHDGRIYYLIPNETTSGENFADKWNTDDRLAGAFFEWHSALLKTLADVQELRGIDQIGKSLSESFGESIVTPAIARLTGMVTSARQGGLLSVAPGLGLAVGRAHGVAVRSNTFFGG